MKSLKYSLLLAIIPISLFLSASALHYAQGPWYLNFYDPSYAYLINSLNLSQFSGFGVGHFDHPGTTVQSTGGIILRTAYEFSGSSTGIIQSVLSDPEKYLLILNKSFVLLNSIGLFLLGIFVLRITGSTASAILLQLSPFVSMEIFYGLIIVTPESFLSLTMLFALGLIVYFLYCGNAGEDMTYSFAVIAGLVCGFGMASKISFIPIVLLFALLIKGVRQKSVFALAAVFSFLIFVYPAIANYRKFAEWISGLLMASGKYGTGEYVFVDTGSFSKNLISIFVKDHLFAVSYFAAIVSVVLHVVRGRAVASKELFYRNAVKLQFIVVLSITLQIIMVAKHYAQYYLIPSFMLTVLALYLSVIIIGNLFNFSKSIPAIRYVFIFLVSCWSLSYIIMSYYEGSEQKSDAFAMRDFITDASVSEAVVPTFGSASPDAALAFGVSYAGSQSERYGQIIDSLGNKKVFFNGWTNRIHTINKTVALSEELCSNNPILLQINIWGSPESFAQEFFEKCGRRVLSVSKIYENTKHEAVYRLEF